MDEGVIPGQNPDLKMSVFDFDVLNGMKRHAANLGIWTYDSNTNYLSMYAKYLQDITGRHVAGEASSSDQLIYKAMTDEFRKDPEVCSSLGLAQDFVGRMGFVEHNLNAHAVTIANSSEVRSALHTN